MHEAFALMQREPSGTVSSWPLQLSRHFSRSVASDLGEPSGHLPSIGEAGAPDVTVEQVREATGAPFSVALD